MLRPRRSSSTRRWRHWSGRRTTARREILRTNRAGLERPAATLRQKETLEGEKLRRALADVLAGGADRGGAGEAQIPGKR